MNTASDHTEADSIIDVTTRAQAGELRPVHVDERYSLLVPDGYTHEVIDLSHQKDRPDRKAGVYHLKTVADFEAYAARQDLGDATTVWVNPDTSRIVAVFDDHVGGDGKTGWGEHRATLDLKASPAWEHWTTMNNRMMGQEAFAEFIEDGEPEIVHPTAAALFDIVSTMQGHTNAEWKQAIRLQDGSVQFTYNEEATATAGGNGELEIPARFELGISPYLGEDPYRLTARLRYRIKSGELTIGYKLDRPEDVLRDAITMIAERLRSTFAGRVFLGVPR